METKFGLHNIAECTDVQLNQGVGEWRHQLFTFHPTTQITALGSGAGVIGFGLGECGEIFSGPESRQQLFSRLPFFFPFTVTLNPFQNMRGFELLRELEFIATNRILLTGQSGKVWGR